MFILVGMYIYTKGWSFPIVTFVTVVNGQKTQNGCSPLFRILGSTLIDPDVQSIVKNLVWSKVKIKGNILTVKILTAVTNY